MVDKDNLMSLYEKLTIKNELTTNDLKILGFGSHDLTQLVKNGTLIRVKRGYYTLGKIDLLYELGDLELRKGNIVKAIEYLEKCNQLSPNNNVIVDTLIKCYIYQKDYKKVFSYYDILLESNNISNEQNFYLYLLNLIMEIPEKYKKYVCKLNLDSVEIIGEEQIQKDIKKLIWRNDYIGANQLYEQYFNQLSILSLEHCIQRDLLIEINYVDEMVKDNISVMVKEQNYLELLNYLMERHHKKILSFKECCYLELVLEILNIQKTKQLSVPEIAKTEDVYEAIAGKNYLLALILSQNKNQNYDDSICSSLLLDICEMIKFLPNNKDLFNYLFESMKVYILENNYDMAFIILRVCLHAMNQKEYEFLITKLLKLDILKNDLEFINTKEEFHKIIRNIDINFLNYVHIFDNLISKNKPEEAKIYYEIISHYNKIKNCNVALPKLKQKLEKSFSKKSVKKINKNENEQFDLEKKYKKLLEEKNYVLLSEMINEETELYKEIKDNPNIGRLEIDLDNKKQTILYYKNEVSENIDIVSLIKSAKQAWRDKKYEEGIEKNLKLLHNTEPIGKTFAYLGNLYLKVNNIEKGIEGLMIATLLSKQDPQIHGYFDFTDLIQKNKQIQIGSHKKEENSKINQYKKYGIKNYKEVLETIFASQLDVESSCFELGLSKEQTNIIKLMIAEQFYIQGFLEKGDQFLKSVEKSPDKTKEIKKLLNDIRKNKNFYQNRQSEKIYKLRLNINPSKK